MQNAHGNSSYNISSSRWQILNQPQAKAWPSIMQGLISINLALEVYKQNPQDNQVRTTFIQTVNQVLNNNSILHNYFEAGKGCGFNLAKIFKAKPNSWGKGNSYLAERFAKISQVLIDKYRVKSFIAQDKQLKSDYRFQLHQLRKSQLGLDYSRYNKEGFKSQFFRLDKSNLDLKYFNKKANQRLGLWLRFRSDVTLSKQIDMLAKYNLTTVQNAHISLRILPHSVPLKFAPLGKLLNSRLPNLRKLTFEVMARELDDRSAPQLKNQLDRLILNFWQQMKQHKHITEITVDLSRYFTQNGHHLKILANAFKYLNYLTSLNLKMEGTYYVNRPVMTNFMRSINSLTKLSTLNFSQLKTYQPNYKLPNMLGPILEAAHLFNKLSQLAINIKQMRLATEDLVELSNVILGMPKLTLITINMEAYELPQNRQINNQALNLFINNLNLSTSLTTLRLTLPKPAHAALDIIDFLFDLNDSIKLELQLNLEVRVLKAISDFTNTLGPSIPTLKNLSELNLVIDSDFEAKAFTFHKLPPDRFLNIYYNNLQQTFKYCKSLSVLKLKLPYNATVTNLIIKALQPLDQLIELEIDLSQYFMYASYFRDTIEFLPLLRRTVNNMKKLTSFKLTTGGTRNDYDNKDWVSHSMKLFIEFIKDLKRLTRFKLSMYRLDQESFEHLASEFRKYIKTQMTVPSSQRSWYTFIVSTSKQEIAANHEYKEFNYYL
jgi:hypothetical protein